MQSIRSAIVLISMPCFCHAADDNLLDFVKTAHISSRGLICNSHCRLKFEIQYQSGTNPPTTQRQSCEAEQWNSANQSRLNVTENNQSFEMTWRDLERTVLNTNNQSSGKMVAAGRGAFPRHTHRGDAWIRTLLVLNIPNKFEWLFFEDFVNQSTKVVKVERRAVDAKEMIVVRLAFGPQADPKMWEVEVYFDPSVNYFIKKVIRFYNGKQDSQEEVVSFKSFGDSLFFPDHIISGMGDASQPFANSRSEAFLSDIQINPRFPTNIFKLQFPHGIIMTDTIRASTYRIDSNGNAISEESSLGNAREPPPGLLPTESQAANTDTLTETIEEPQSWTRWVLPLSSGCVVVGLLLVL